VTVEADESKLGYSEPGKGTVMLARIGDGHRQAA
jgi:hypothetical protein